MQKKPISSGCWKGAEMNQPRSKRIAVLMADGANPFWKDMERHYRRMADERHILIECFWPVPWHDPFAQSDLLLKIADAGF